MENYAYGFVNSLYPVAADQPTDAVRKESSREPTNNESEPEQCESDRQSETEGKKESSREPTNKESKPEQCESDRESETEGKCQWFELRQ